MSGVPEPAAAIRLVIFDVDGVFTDGLLYLSDDGVETKSFNVKDGHGVKQLLRAGIEVAIISGRSSAAVDRRMEELGVRPSTFTNSPAAIFLRSNSAAACASRV